MQRTSSYSKESTSALISIFNNKLEKYVVLATNNSDDIVAISFILEKRGYRSFVQASLSHDNIYDIHQRRMIN